MIQLCLLAGASLCLALAREGFYNIAHMVNTISAVDWALGRGANGVEMDIQFNTTTGDVLKVQHGPPCGCTCVCPSPDWRKCEFATGHVCATLYNDVKGRDPCDASTDVKAMFAHLASRKEILFINLDSKIDSATMGPGVMEKAGKNIVQTANKYLFDNNYGGIALVGAEYFGSLPYLKAAVREAAYSRYKNRIYFTFENERNKIIQVLEALHSLSTSNIVYGTGLSPCIHGTPVKNSTLELATINKVQGVIGMSYIWTVDNDTNIRHDLDYVQGIITNYPGRLNTLLRESGIKLAKQDSRIPAATSSAVIANTTGYSCNCTYRDEGCSISQAAPRGLACKCIQSGLSSCTGKVVQCLDPEDHHCYKPDTSVYSCLQGLGYCQGYKESKCICDFNGGGCSISRPPPPSIACMCTLNANWTCKGEVAICRDEDSRYCRHPDHKVQTCVQGGGNCDGYNDETCDCNKYGDGCYISRAPPRYTACRCVMNATNSCRGEIVSCLNRKSKFCETPEKSIYSCFQGTGNCNGYVNATCGCRYRNGGCVITKASPPSTSCVCQYDGHQSCTVSLSWCRDTTSYYCRHPDTSRSTCLLGGGNCSGYYS